MVVVTSEAVDAAMAEAEPEDEEAMKAVAVTEAEGGSAVTVAAIEVASVVAEEASKAQKSLGKTMETCVLTLWR